LKGLILEDFFLNSKIDKSVKNSYICMQNVCHENKSAVCRVVVLNFGRDGGRPTTFGEQALIVNHFMLL
jgi:hypothetical protein